MYLQNHRSEINGTPLESRQTECAKEARKKGHNPALFGHTDTSSDPRDCALHHHLMLAGESRPPGIEPDLLMAQNEAA